MTVRATRANTALDWEHVMMMMMLCHVREAVHACNCGAREERQTTFLGQVAKH
jgi:hypothetical protein